MDSFNTWLKHYSKLYDAYVEQALDLLKQAKKEGNKKSLIHIQYLINRLNSKNFNAQSQITDTEDK